MPVDTTALPGPNRLSVATYCMLATLALALAGCAAPASQSTASAHARMTRRDVELADAAVQRALESTASGAEPAISAASARASSRSRSAGARRSHRPIANASSPLTRRPV